MGDTLHPFSAGDEGAKLATNLEIMVTNIKDSEIHKQTAKNNPHSKEIAI
jgi:hypothetical protein